MSNKLYAAAAICGFVSLIPLAHFSTELLIWFMFYHAYKGLVECGNAAAKEEKAEKQPKPKD